MNNKKLYTQSKHTKCLAYSFLAIMLIQMIAPTTSYALTSGPTQPEVQGFTQYGTTDIVDPFTGSFSYNIPLLEIPGPDGGYPINLAYSSGISMDQEASWVGLGWNLNVGCINREMRGLPDDFDGEPIKNKKFMKPNITIGAGVSFGIEFEFAGTPVKDILNLSLSKGLKFYYNNYNGLGMTQEGGFNIGASGKNGGFGGSIGLNMSQDNIEGGKISPSIGLSYSGKKNPTKGNLDIGMNFSSRYGLQGVSLNVSVSKSKKIGEHQVSSKVDDCKYRDVDEKRGGSLNVISANFSYAGAAASPTINDEMYSEGFNASLQLGGEIYVGNIDGEINGFWNKEELTNNNQWVENYGYGFNYLQNAAADDALMDFDRSLDQPVSPSVKTIAQPVLNYDIYSVRGQGIGAMLRPFRSDVGMLKDDNKHSDGWNASVAGEVAIGQLVHGGGSGYVGLSDAYSGNWNRDGDINSSFKFKGSEDNNPYYEPVTYQSYGEVHALDKTETQNLLQGFKPTFININGSGREAGDYKTDSSVSSVDRSGIFIKYPILNNTLSKRLPRNISIQHFTNAQLNTKDNILKQFDIKYTTNLNNGYNLNNLSVTIDRSNLPQKQIGGFEAVNTSGLRYIYGLPAYNLENVECTYSTERVNDYKVNCIPSPNNEDPIYNQPGSYEHYFEKNVLPKYAHSYLLTSVLGPDYIDMDDNGVSDKDLGYWVKFNYLKTNGEDAGLEPYQWRAPFTGGNLNEKLQSKDRDDVGTYAYGKRENFYVTSIETKTHIAEFYVSTRHDAKGAKEQIQQLGANINAILGSNSFKLDSIKLYTKPERYNKNGTLNVNAIPIKVVHFEYAGYDGKYLNVNELCRGVENGESTNTGKLTLKSVWFSYRNNEKGKNNAYVFNYHEDIDEENPNYSPFDYNRWGDYQPEDVAYTKNKYFPYVRQDLSKAEIDRRTSVWNLKEIELPTGALMKVNYESNDYAYVQNKPAMQMYKIASVGKDPNSSFLGQYAWDTKTVFFKLPDNLTQVEADALIKEYVDQTKQLYFKIKVDLTNRGDTEYVSGYANIDKIEAIPISGVYYGKITLAPQYVKKLHSDAHPFAVSSWNYLLMNRPEIIEGPNFIIDNPENTNKAVLIGNMVTVLMKGIFSFLPMVQNYYRKAAGEGFGQGINLNESFIRLNNVTGAKYGAGCRVKSVDLIAKNLNNVLDTFGTVYDYKSIDDRTGKIISSGVATYEPQIGGDENALKHALFYENKVAMRNFIPTFSELPLNENYFPAPSVGYSKVTIRSRATDLVDKGLLPSSIPTTGQTVEEFYTAKDFPTISDYTPLVNGGTGLSGNMLSYHHNYPIPIIGSFTNEELSISQGFSVELNDMHGKPKATYTYAQNEEGNIIEGMPISYEKYIYKNADLSADLANGYRAKKLVNEANVMYEEGKIENKLLGLDFEYFGDARETNSVSSTFGMRINGDAFIAPPIPLAIASMIPTIGRDVKGVRLAANNKIIHRFGLLDSIIQFNEGSLVQTSNELYDAYTGNPVLTKLNDEYGNYSYSYTMPAYWQYEGMGPAYLNSSFAFEANVDSQNVDNKYIGLKVSDINIIKYLYQGDELAIKNGDREYVISYIIQIDDNKDDYGRYTIWIDTKATYGLQLVKAMQYDCIVIKSGRKNMLTIPAGSIISKTNPVTNRVNYECK